MPGAKYIRLYCKREMKLTLDAASITKGPWDYPMMNKINRNFYDPFTYSTTHLSSHSAEDNLGGYGRVRTPWEIKEGENAYKMRFDMPGMTKKDVKLSVEENMLVIKTKKQPKKDEEGDELDDEEWSATSYGRHNSKIALPENVAIDKIKAEVKEGVLYITIPRAKVVDINVQ